MPRIIKTDGSSQEFDLRKLAHSMERAGADAEGAQEIASEIARAVTDGMTTHEIYGRAFALLRKRKNRAAAHYSLKRAVLEFGPSGFPFEAYLAELFRTQGYAAAIDRHIAGRCVEHEVDVMMTREDPREIVYVEAKFHNAINFKTDLQVALYVQARIEDIAAANHHEADRAVRGMLATNTKFTDLVVQYAACRGLSLLSWEYPENDNLHHLISRAHLYPITVLSSLGHSAKENLLREKVVLCRDVINDPDALGRAGVQSRKIPEILTEAAGLCKGEARG